MWNLQIVCIALSSLGSALQPSLKLRALDWAIKSGEVKLQDFFYPIGGVASNREGSHQAWKYFKENFDYLKSKLSKASPSLMDALVVNCVSRMCTVEQAQEVELYFRQNPLPSSGNNPEVSQLNPKFLTRKKKLNPKL